MVNSYTSVHSKATYLKLFISFVTTSLTAKQQDGSMFVKFSSSLHTKDFLLYP